MEVIIVDDERNIREGIERLIDWESLGCHVAASFSNGASALDYLRKNDIDIVITDIKMPVMDGLEMARILAEEKNRAKVIILTAYSDFEYAKMAIRYHVSDFIIKNEFIEELPAAVNKVISVINKEREQKNANAGAAGKSPLNDAIYKCITTGKYDVNSAETDMYKFVVCACDIEEYDDASSGRNYLQMLKNILKIGLKDCQFEIYENTEKYFIIAVYYRKDSHISLGRIIEYFGNIIIMIEEFMRINIKFGIGSETENIAELKTSYEHAKAALSGITAKGSEVKVYTESKEAGRDFDVDAKMDTIIEQIFDETENIAEESLKEMYDEIAKRYLSLESCQLYMLVICSGAIHRAVRYHIDTEVDFSDMEKEVYEKIQGAKTIFTLLQIGKETIDKIRSLCIGKKSFRNELVSKVDECIKEHYKEEINLQFISEKLFLSGSYVSRAYKKMTGLNVTEKIMLFRIAKAKELLSQTSLKVYEIAAQVGFKDAPYFTNVFMKYTGMSPSDYRNCR
ncbi:MAG: response regulator [Lachnospiraceae bacterium]|nr:response regulator [Lachnospiraceae bacterium]